MRECESCRQALNTVKPRRMPYSPERESLCQECWQDAVGVGGMGDHDD